MIGIGDIVLVGTSPPHIASVMEGNVVVCEDGTTMPLNLDNMKIVCSALQVVKELERSVLLQNENRGLYNY